MKNVLIDEMPVPSAYAGDHASLVLNGLEQSNVSNGMVACDPTQPIAVTKRIQARIVVFNIELPITKGYPVVFHYGSVQVREILTVLVLFSLLEISIPCAFFVSFRSTEIEAKELFTSVAFISRLVKPTDFVDTE